MQLSIVVISPNNIIEILLKQYFKSLDITTSDSRKDADIIVDQTDQKQVRIEIKNNDRFWIITKPISVIKLTNIVKQAIQILSENIIQIGPITFYPEQKLCKFIEEEIALTVKETEILLYLSRYPNLYIDRETLLNAIWGYAEDISTHTLETHIYKLRTKFAEKYNLISSNDSGYSLSI